MSIRLVVRDKKKSPVYVSRVAEGFIFSREGKVYIKIADIDNSTSAIDLKTLKVVRFPPLSECDVIIGDIDINITRTE